MGKRDTELETRIRRKMADRLRIDDWEARHESIVRSLRTMGNAFRETIEEMETDFIDLKRRVKGLEDKDAKIQKIN